MNKRYAVGYYSQMDNILLIELHEANSPEEAATLHSQFNGVDWESSYSEGLESMKKEAFNMGCGLDVIEIPNA